jgi:multicomponent Na+:H+ antiporter subunit E
VSRLQPGFWVLAALWWVLAGAAEPASWVIGLPAVCGAWLLRRRLNPFPARAVRLPGLLRFAGTFLKLSVLSGIEVVRMALHPRLPLRPGIVEYSMGVASPVDRMVLAGTANLLPGTLTVDLRGDRLLLHVLDIQAPVLRDVRTIEALVAGMHRPTRPDIGRRST